MSCLRQLSIVKGESSRQYMRGVEGSDAQLVLAFSIRGPFGRGALDDAPRSLFPALDLLAIDRTGFGEMRFGR